MVQSCDSKGNERRQRKLLEGKMDWEGARNNMTGMQSRAQLRFPPRSVRPLWIVMA